MPVVFARLLIGMPGTAFDRLLVANCPFCLAYVHLHNVPSGTARSTQVIRSPRCSPSRIYSIEITDVIAAAPQRRRGAA